MQKLLTSRKGFTLIELIVVIVILAILIAALTPAIISVIERANRSADEADARMVMMIGSVAGTGATPPQTPTFAQFETEWGINAASNNIHDGLYNIWFDGPMGVGVRLVNARSRQSQQANGGVTIGTATPAGGGAGDLTIQVTDGAVAAVVPGP